MISDGSLQMESFRWRRKRKKGIVTGQRPFLSGDECCLLLLLTWSLTDGSKMISCGPEAT